MSAEMVGRIVDACNGHLLRGARKLVGGYVRNGCESRFCERYSLEKALDEGARLCS